MKINIQDKTRILYSRYIKIVIEWGGVKDMFSNMSDLDEDLAVKLLLGFKKEMSSENFNKLISEVVTEQNDRENE